MSVFRKRRGPPPRRPHPDPRAEAGLQRIISLRRAAARKEAELDGEYAHLRELNRTTARHPAWGGHFRRIAQANAIRERVGETEKAVAALHGEIAKRVEALSDTDLAYLEPAPALRGAQGGGQDG